jgi:hypothetical protein
MFSLTSLTSAWAARVIVGAALLVAAPAQAQWGYFRAQAAVPWAGQGCGYGSYRAPNGACDIVKDPNWRCQPGFHDVPTPIPNGYRCVMDGF